MSWLSVHAVRMYRSSSFVRLMVRLCAPLV